MIAVMLNIADGRFDEAEQAVRQTKAVTALNNMRSKAVREGFKSDEEIEALIDKARRSSVCKEL